MENQDLTQLSKLDYLLKERPDASQRDIAKAIGMSLGMTNSLLKRFSDKGYLYLKKISQRNIQYILTPAGMNELTHRSYRYFKRTLKQVHDYKEILLEIVSEAKNAGSKKIILLGESDLSFILEYACMIHKLSFKTCKNIDNIEPTNILESDLLFISETFLSSDEPPKLQNLSTKIEKIYLHKLLV
ncbi:MAG TPA: winged helix-turn-helix transcriptional regulator [Treponemataceae bacterium]|jgi:DNA-binding MarR family transcriptional regulator|nr:winged helix-turn-helix transcriptional regulator [Treponemataceae bacterium]